MRPVGHFRLACAIGHRGLAAEAPENSLAGLRVAAKRGFKWCEVDAQSCADGVAVLHHDPRLAGAAGKNLAELSSAELAATAIGSNPDTGRRECVPTLQQAVEFAAQLGLGLVVEIKSGNGVERDEITTAAVAKVLRGLGTGGLLVASFNFEVLAHIARVLPDMPRAVNVLELPEEPPRGVDNVHFKADLANGRRVAAVKACGLGAYAYVVNSPDEVRRMLRMGADGFIAGTSKMLGV